MISQSDLSCLLLMEVVQLCKLTTTSSRAYTMCAVVIKSYTTWLSYDQKLFGFGKSKDKVALESRAS